MPRVSTILTILLTISATLAFLVSTAFAQTQLTGSTLKKIERSATIMVDKKSGNYCTVFPVSADGYMLTAVHCLKTCLEAQPSSNPSDFYCADQTIPSLGVEGVRVVAIGDALRPQSKTSRFGDYAVLKIETKKSLSCLVLSEKRASAGEALWAMGYPVPSLEATAPALSASAGKLYEAPEQSRFFKAQRNKAERDSVSQLYARASGVMYSDAHHMPGQSGGPVVDKDGAVIGVVSGFTITRAGKKEIHELVAGSTEKILKTLPLKLSSLLIEKSRDCQARL